MSSVRSSELDEYSYWAVGVVAQQEPATRAPWQRNTSEVICPNELEAGHLPILLAPAARLLVDPTEPRVLSEADGVRGAAMRPASDIHRGSSRAFNDSPGSCANPAS